MWSHSAASFSFFDAKVTSHDPTCGGAQDSQIVKRCQAVPSDITWRPTGFSLKRHHNWVKLALSQKAPCLLPKSQRSSHAPDWACHRLHLSYGCIPRIPQFSQCHWAILGKWCQQFSRNWGKSQLEGLQVLCSKARSFPASADLADANLESHEEIVHCIPLPGSWLQQKTEAKLLGIREWQPAEDGIHMIHEEKTHVSRSPT